MSIFNLKNTTLFFSILLIFGCEMNSESMKKKKQPRYKDSIKLFSRDKAGEQNHIEPMNDSLRNQLNSTKSRNASERNLDDILRKELEQMNREATDNK